MYKKVAVSSSKPEIRPKPNPKPKPTTKTPEPKLTQAANDEDDDLKDLLGNANNPRGVGSIVKCGFLHFQTGRSESWDHQYFFLYSRGRLHSSPRVLDPPRGQYLMVKSLKDVGVMDEKWHEFSVRGTLEPVPETDEPKTMEYTFRTEFEQSSKEHEHQANWPDTFQNVINGVYRQEEKSAAHFRISMKNFRNTIYPPELEPIVEPGQVWKLQLSLYYIGCWPNFEEDMRG